MKMKPKYWILGIVALSWFALSFSKQSKTIEMDTCEVKNSVFNVGEEITYKIYYNLNFIWIPAGEVTFRVRENDTQYHITAAGRTYPSYEWFYSVRDYFETYIDKNTMLPDTFMREVNEGNFTMYNKMTFDQENQKITSYKGKTKETAKEEEVDYAECMHDIMSIVYSIRNKEFDEDKIGARIPIKVALDGEVYPLSVEYKGISKKKKVKGLGKFNLHEFSPELIAGNVFTEDAKMKLFVSADENKIPVLIESPVSVGSVKVVLKEYKNLKYDFVKKAK
jgi:hypothetical protein